MRSQTRLPIFIRAAAAALGLLTLPAAAQSYRVLHALDIPAGNPIDLLKGVDGNLYVTSAQGGAYNSGAIFQMVPGGATTPFYSFHGPDGTSPRGGLVQDPGDSSFYGTTNLGGALDHGTVFKIDATGTLVWSYSFDGSGGMYPAAGLLLDNGVLYGTTEGGGNNYQGTVFRIATDGTSPQFFPFDGSGTQGSGPASALVKVGSTLYGTTASGGANGSGSVFSIPIGAGTPAAIYSFTAVSPVDGTNATGAYPVGPLMVDAGGHLYGTASNGGANAIGTVFKIDLSNPTSPAWVHSLTGSDGAIPNGLVDGHDGFLYGATTGTVFRIDPSSDALTPLASFSSPSGSAPRGLLKDGSLFYGTAMSGGPNGTGTVFRLDSTYTLSILYAFPIPAGQDGALPLGDLVWDGTNTWLYGTTANGGQHRQGTVFRVKPSDGTFETIYAFTGGSDGSSPQSALVLIAGDFYGTTAVGGTAGLGTVFRITACVAPPPCTPTLTPLHSFSGSDGFSPGGPLAYRSADGFLYGTAGGGGASKGTAYRIKASDGTGFQTLYNFSGTSDGQGPTGGLLYGGGTTFYGTAVLGGANSNGTVFALDTSTTPATLMWKYSFTPLTGSARTNLDGVNPYGGLVDGGDGYLYGTTSGGGHYGLGAVFQIRKSDGSLGNSHGFLNQGQSPQAGLVRGTGGFLYGTTASGGPYQGGTIFRWDSSNNNQDDLTALTSLHDFSWYGGTAPRAGLVPDGLGTTFYGTASTGGHGGPAGTGVVFSLTLGPAPAPTVTSVFPASGPDSGGTPVMITGSNFQPGATVTFGGLSANPSTTVTLDPGTIMAVTPADPGATAVDVVVTNHPDTLSGTLPLGFTYAPVCTPPAPPLASNAGPYCVGDTISLSAATVAGASYSWIGPAAFTSNVQSPTIPSASTAMAGNYTVTITVAGCTFTGTTTVAVNTCGRTPTPVITTLPFVGAGSPNRKASVALHAGSSYTWAILTGNGTIDPAGQGTNAITFTAGTQTGTLTLSVTESDPAYGNIPSLPATADVTILEGTSALQFYTVTPCRLVDTRGLGGSGVIGGPNLDASPRLFVPTQGTSCPIPSTAKALAANVTVVGTTGAGFLRLWGDGEVEPATSTLNFKSGLTRANNAVVTMPGGASQGFWVRNSSTGVKPLIVDVYGYFE